MEPGGSMLHSQGLANYPYHEPNQPISLKCILILSFHLRLGLPKGLFPVKILKALLPSSILATWPAHLSSGFNHAYCIGPKMFCVHYPLGFYKDVNKSRNSPCSHFFAHLYYGMQYVVDSSPNYPPSPQARQSSIYLQALTPRFCYFNWFYGCWWTTFFWVVL